MTTHSTHQNASDPVNDHGRRRAVITIMGRAPALIRYALRYSMSLADAEDAYQRAMEIALTRAPNQVGDDVMAWFHTVIRREALAIKESYQHEEPHGDEEQLHSLGGAVSTRSDHDPQIAYAWRERYRTIQDALSGLTDTQRTCLMLRSAGASRHEIEDITGFTARKVDRAIVEGRRRLREFEMRVESGDACRGMTDLIGRVLDHEASAAEQRKLSVHVRHCGTCRSEFRERRDQSRLLSSFVPGVLLVPSAVAEPLSSDPSVALSFWERVTQGGQFRAAQATQVWLDLPALLATRAGAGAAAVVIAGAIGTPVVVDAVRTDAVPAASAGTSVSSPTTIDKSVVRAAPSGVVAKPVTKPAPRVKVTPKRPVKVVRSVAKPKSKVATPVVSSAATRTWTTPAPTTTRTTRVQSSSRSTRRSGSAEAEFSP